MGISFGVVVCSTTMGATTHPARRPSAGAVPGRWGACLAVRTPSAAFRPGVRNQRLAIPPLRARSPPLDLDIARVEQAAQKGEVQAVVREASRPGHDDAELVVAARLPMVRYVDCEGVTTDAVDRGRP